MSLQADHSNLPFEWQAMQAQWWDDLGILPSHPTVPPLHHIPDITLPTLHRMKGLIWYRGIADPPPPSLRPSPPCTGHPCRPPPSYATANPSVMADRPAPPMARNFLDGLGYTVRRDILFAEDARSPGGAWKKFGGRGTKFPNILTRCSM